MGALTTSTNPKRSIPPTPIPFLNTTSIRDGTPDLLPEPALPEAHPSIPKMLLSAPEGPSSPLLPGTTTLSQIPPHPHGFKGS